jgi:hypothetical protein
VTVGTAQCTVTVRAGTTAQCTVTGHNAEPPAIVANVTAHISKHLHLLHKTLTVVCEAEMSGISMLMPAAYHLLTGCKM